jgi:hypothetical protein
MSSVYDTHAPKLMAHGYAPLVIGPGTKWPQDWVPSLGRYQDARGWQDPRRRAATSPQPDAGIGLRCGQQANGAYIVALDWDNETAALAAMETFPASNVTKEGRRGFTGFYRSHKQIPSRDFKIDGTMAVQVLSDGKQTVLPPTIHSDLNQPYRWTGDFTLYDISPEDLPELPEDYVERVEAILRPLGYEPEPEKPKGNGHDTEDDNPFRELNRLALRNLIAWVPDLNLYNCRRLSGRTASYEAVADWRPSTEGRPLEKRDRNLKISGSKGIKDFGNGETFSALDLVMRARSCSLSEAVAWLEERVRPNTGPEIDFDAILNGPGARSEIPNDEARAKNEEPPKKKRRRFKFIPFWELRPGATEMPYLIDELIPAKGIVLFWGPPKCLKSFFMLDAMFHVARGWEYRDRHVQQGTVVYCAFEGSHGYEKRGEALRRHYELEDSERTPLVAMAGNADLIKEHKVLVEEIREEVERYVPGTVPAAVVLDTLNKSLHGSESKDIDMASYIRAAEAVRDAFGCVVIIVHHCGWDESRMRGHSSLRGAVDAELSVTREDDVVTVTVEEMRDGPEGVQIISKSRIVEVGEDAGGRTLTSLVLVPHDPAPGSGPTKTAKWPASLKTFQDALIEATLTSGFDFQIETGPKVKAVDLGKVREAFYALYVVASDEAITAEQRQNSKRKAFMRAVDKARASHLIGARALDNGLQLIWSTSSYAF